MKIFKSFLIVMVVLAAIVTASCEQRILESNQHEFNGRVVGFVNGVIRDANTGELMPNVEVSWNAGGRSGTTRTDQNGFYAISNLFQGRYVLTIRPANSHASVVREFTVPDLRALGVDELHTSEDFRVSLVENFELVQKQSTVKGFVYARTATNTRVRVPNAKIVATLPAQYYPRYIYATTDAEGMYIFENIPSTGTSVDFRVEGQHKIGNIVYATTVTRPATLAFNRTVMLNHFELTIVNQDVVIMHHTLNSYREGRNVAFTFNREIVAASFNLEIVNMSDSEEVEYTLNWPNPNEVVITVDEYLAPNTQYRFTMSGRATASTRNDITNFDFYIYLTTPDF